MGGPRFKSGLRPFFKKKCRIFFICDPAFYERRGLVLISNSCHYIFLHSVTKTVLVLLSLSEMCKTWKKFIDWCTWRYKESYSPWDLKGPKLLQRSSGPALCEGADERDYRITIMYVFRSSLNLLQCNICDVIIWARDRYVTSSCWFRTICR